MYYTVIKHSGHLRTLEKYRKHSPAARVVYISLVFSNARRVLSQCNTRLGLLYFLNIYIYIYISWRIKDDASILCQTELLSDERLGAKLRVTENRCVIFNPPTYVYLALLPQHWALYAKVDFTFTFIYIYIYTYIYTYIHTYCGKTDPIRPTCAP